MHCSANHMVRVEALAVIIRTSAGTISSQTTAVIRPNAVINSRVDQYCFQL